MTITITRNPDHTCNLLINGEIVIRDETYNVVDQVREAMYGHRAGIAGECLEVAESILRWKQWDSPVPLVDEQKP